MKSSLLSSVLIVILATAAGPAGRVRAAEPAATPTAQQVLDRYVEATGGRAALEKLTSRLMKGTIEVTTLGASARFEARAKAPNKQVSRIDFEGFGLMQDGFDGKVAWASVPGQGVRQKSGGELARAERTSGFPRELKIRQAYGRFEVRGAAKVGESDAWIVEASPREGKPDRLYFDQKSGLLVREESTIDTAVGEMTFQVDFEDFRAVDGVKVPFRMRMPKPAEMGFQIKFEEIKHNVDIADGDFALPKS